MPHARSLAHNPYQIIPFDQRKPLVRNLIVFRMHSGQTRHRYHQYTKLIEK
jgi:hypothetical protein